MSTIISLGVVAFLGYIVVKNAAELVTKIKEKKKKKENPATTEETKETECDNNEEVNETGKEA